LSREEVLKADANELVASASAAIAIVMLDMATIIISAWASLIVPDSNKRSIMAQNECRVLTGSNGICDDDRQLLSMI
jgi:hypothetical protein